MDYRLERVKNRGTLARADQSAGPLRRVRFWGREWVEAPATLVRSQVLVNNLGRCLLAPEAMTPEWGRAAAGAPALIGDHPAAPTGEPVSGRDPEWIELRGAGWVWKTRVEEEPGEGAGRPVKRLVGAVYLDPSRAAEVEGLGAVLAALERGEVVELSTGFDVLVREEAGEWLGEPYDLVIEPVAGLDHLAIFPPRSGAEGACSVEDGCGLGVGAAVNVLRRARRPVYRGTTEEPWRRPRLEDWVGPDRRWADLSAEEKRRIVESTLLGEVEDTYDESLVFPVVTPEGLLSRRALLAVRSIARGGRGGADLPEEALESAYEMAGRLLEEEFGEEERAAAARRAADPAPGDQGVQRNQEASTMEDLDRTVDRWAVAAGADAGAAAPAEENGGGECRCGRHISAAAAAAEELTDGALKELIAGALTADGGRAGPWTRPADLAADEDWGAPWVDDLLWRAEEGEELWAAVIAVPGRPADPVRYYRVEVVVRTPAETGAGWAVELGEAVEVRRVVSWVPVEAAEAAPVEAPAESAAEASAAPAESAEGPAEELARLRAELEAERALLARAALEAGAPWPEEELLAKPLAELHRIIQLARRAQAAAGTSQAANTAPAAAEPHWDYIGLGGARPRPAAGEAAPATAAPRFAPHVPYWAAATERGN